MPRMLNIPGRECPLWIDADAVRAVEVLEPSVDLVVDDTKWRVAVSLDGLEGDMRIAVDSDEERDALLRLLGCDPAEAA